MITFGIFNHFSIIGNCIDSHIDAKACKLILFSFDQVIKYQMNRKKQEKSKKFEHKQTKGAH